MGQCQSQAQYPEPAEPPAPVVAPLPQTEEFSTQQSVSVAVNTEIDFGLSANQLQAQLAQNQEQMQGILDVKTKLEQQLRTFQASEKDNQVSKLHYDLKVNTMRQQIENYRQQLSDISALQTGLQDELLQLKAKCRQQEDEISQAQDREKLLENEIVSLVSQFAIIPKAVENETPAQRHESQRKKMARMEAEIQRLQMELAGKEKEILALKNKK